MFLPMTQIVTETATSDPTTDPVATQVPEAASATERAAAQPAEEITPRPRMPRPHCAC